MIGDREWLDTPPPKRITVSAWTERLRVTFGQDGIIGGSTLLPVFAAERDFAATADDALKGHLLLAESFQAFAFETLRLAEKQWRLGPFARAFEWYAVTLMECAALFRKTRAAEILYHHGYPLDGMSLLRDVRDRTVFLAAIGMRQATQRELAGYANDQRGRITPETWPEMLRRTELVERRLMRWALGSDSRLPEATQEELKGWTQLFNLEVHGARLTRSGEFKEWIVGLTALPLIPVPNTFTMATYANRFAEVAWMFLRVLPLLQTSPGAFGAEWARKWAVLDEAFRLDLENLWRMHKPIAGAIICMIDAKFVFSPRDSYRGA